MKRILITSAALALFAVPAHAQLLGGLGGSLGGNMGGTLGGTLGGAGSVGSATDSIGSATRGTLENSGNASVSAHADRRSGRIDANGQGNGNILGEVGSTLGTPSRSVGGNSSANGSASGGRSASAQLIGTDAVRGLASSTSAQVQAAARYGQAAAQGLLVTPGTLSGSANGSGSGSGSYSAGPLSGFGDVAGTGQGGFLVESGTPIFGADGDKIGKVRQVFTDTQGHVQNLLVRVDGQTATIPASNFQANGRGLVSAMGEGQIKKVAQQQERAQ